jgi:hypothetical protein
MARATRLRVLANRPAEPGDDQLTVEAFPAPPPHVQPGSQRGEDVLALLRADTDRALTIAGQANTAANAALDHAARASSDTAALAGAAETLAQRQTAVEVATRTIGNQTVAAIDDMTKAQRASAGQAGAVMMTAAERIVATLAQLIAYILARLPMLLALGSAVWLWQQVLASPTPMQLIGLGLFGALVIGPVLWLTTRNGGTG